MLDGGGAHLESSISSDLQISTSSKALALGRIQTHSFCTAFMYTPKTGKMSQLKKYRSVTVPWEGSSHTHGDRPPSGPKNANTLV